MRIEGDTFQPCPSSRAALAPVPSVAMPPLPGSPLKFSGLMERVTAFDSRDRLPGCIFKPLNIKPPDFEKEKLNAKTQRKQSLLVVSYQFLVFSKSIKIM